MHDFQRHPDPKRQLAMILRGESTGQPAPRARVAFPLLITAPLPPKECWPNARVHWAALSKARKKQKTDARLAAREIPALMLRKCVAQPVFFFSTNRRRDRDNAAASLKATWDGLVVHGLLADDEGLLPLPPIFKVDRERPRLEIEIRLEV